MMMYTRVATLALAAAVAVPAAAQSPTQPEPQVEGTDPGPPAVQTGAGARVFTAADFVRFSPKTAYDMLVQVPGFSIRQANTDRGLGQASENVLINGQRIANKSGGALDELRKVPAGSVERIEIVEAATLGIAGLAGQVANVIVKQDQASSGQFEWNPDIRAHYAKPNLFRGNASWSGKSGWLDYTLSVRDQAGRGAFGGPIVLTDAAGKIIETRDQIFHSESDLVTFQVKLGIDGPGDSVGNLTLGYTPYWNPTSVIEQRYPVGGIAYERSNRTRLVGWYYDISGDYTFGVGPGKLKLIGVRHWDKEPVTYTQIDSFADGSPDTGSRFVRDSRIAETVFRAEYGWKGGANDWQISFERAFNSLDQRGGLFVLDTAGDFVEVPYPQGSGKVTETRYEGIATWSRSLSPTLDLQVAGGAEISELARVDGDIPPRKFFRPKGSVTLGWRPAEGWDASLRLNRRVGQISFYDFLSQPNLQQERESTGNPDLVPPQSWQVEAEVGKTLGPWGKTRLRVYHHWIEDIVDTIPLGPDDEAVGNLPSARRMGVDWHNTIELAPLGLRGAKLDTDVKLERSRVRDPLSGLKRPISGNFAHFLGAEFRHDIPGSDIAYGFSGSNSRNAPYVYLTEISENWEGPWFVNAYIEHKDVFGLTVRATAGNIFNARHRVERDKYDGRRLSDPLEYHQSHDQLIGPIFSLLVKGTF
ncbi:TonB-dependent receptor plug domain-containing protein [Tsuneonella sp. HG222]